MTEVDMSALPIYAHWESTGTFKIPIVGTSHYRDAIVTLAQNPPNVNALASCLAYLVADDQNPHDPNAVKVIIRGLQVGHLSRDFAKSYRAYITELPGHIQHISAAAMITNGISTAAKQYEYAIELDIPDSLRMGMRGAPLADDIIRINGYAPLRSDTDGSYFAKVWVPVADFNELHASRRVETWTTDAWDTVNFYAENRQNCGLGFKVYQLPKQQYANLFSESSVSATLLLDTTRFATLRIERVSG
jgi:hypothetical protein